MTTKKYPIGTSIIYLGDCEKCRGKIGKVVEVSKDYYYITLPQSTCSVFNRADKVRCDLLDIKPAVKKNEQLLFNFMR